MLWCLPRMETLSEFSLGDTTARYLHDPATGRVGLVLFPTARADQVVRRRVNLNGDPFAPPPPGAWNPPAVAVDSLAQIKILGDPYSAALAGGHTMRQSASIGRFRYEDQASFVEPNRTRIVTILKSADGLALEHILCRHKDENALEVTTRFFNGSDRAVTLEMLSSFSLSGLSPFDFSESTNRLNVHRFRTVWAAEGRLETQGIAAACTTARAEKFSFRSIGAVKQKRAPLSGARFQSISVLFRRGCGTKRGHGRCAASCRWRRSPG